MTRFVSLAVLAALVVAVIASPLATSPGSMDVAKTSLPSNKTSNDGLKLALTELADSSSVAVGGELNGNKKGNRSNCDNKKGKEHIQKNKKNKDNKGGRRPDNRRAGNRSEDKTFHGRGTWFNGTFGSCGVKFSQSDLIVALNEEQMGGSGRSSRCGQRIRVTAKGSNASVVVRVVDTCPKECCKFGMLDLSKAAFSILAPESKGVLDLSWSFI